MIDELRAQAPDVALRAVDESLHTIAEREDAGYITERMIGHRLRLVAFGAELGAKELPRSSLVPPVDAVATGVTADGTKVLAEWIAHGESTEIVNGKEKLLRASFVLRLDLQNTRAVGVTLQPPTIEGTFPLPVSRWYAAGGAGEPWSGELSAGERRIVHVIGYIGEPIAPGTEVDAKVHLGSLSLSVRARARRRWNEPLAD
jgi:hypothetical protein